MLAPGELAQTLIACDAELTAQEQWINALLGSNPSIELDGDELELSSGENSITFGETGLTGASRQPALGAISRAGALAATASNRLVTPSLR